MIKACHLTIALTALTAGAIADTYENPVIGQDWPDPTFWQAPDGWVYGVATSLKTTMRSRDLVHWEDTLVAPIAGAGRSATAASCSKAGRKAYATAPSMRTSCRTADGSGCLSEASPAECGGPG